MRHFVLLLALCASMNSKAQNISYTYNVYAPLFGENIVVVYFDEESSEVLVHYEKGVLNVLNVDYKLYDFKDTTITEISSWKGIAYKDKYALDQVNNSLSNFDFFHFEKDTLELRDTLMEYNPFATNDSLNVAHYAQLLPLSHTMSYTLPNATILIEGQYYYYLRKESEVIDDVPIDISYQSTLLRIDYDLKMPSLEYELVPSYEILIEE